MTTPEVHVEWTVNGVPQADLPLDREEVCYWYNGNLTGNLSVDDVVTYRVIATDNAVAPNVSILPMSGEIYCPIAGPDSIGIVSLCSRPFTVPFLMENLGILGIAHTCYTEWPKDWNAHDTWFICLGVFPYNHVLSSTEANEVVAALQAGKNICLEGGDTWCYDPEKATLNPWFGVQEVSRGPGMSMFEGVTGSIMDGISFKYIAENLEMDVIAAVNPAEAVFANTSGMVRAVIKDAGTYRAIASAFSLGGIWDKSWPNTGKEALLRYLEFLGWDDIQLTARAKAKVGSNVPVRLEGDPDDGYLLLASFADFYMEIPGYGMLRLDPNYLFILSQGVIPSTGVKEFTIPIPRKDEYIGTEIHLQAVTGPDFSPGTATLTNREILTVLY